MMECHLVFFVHGLWGHRTHFDYICKVLEEYFPHDDETSNIVVHTTTLNEGFKTYDGIDVCGFRLAQEMMSVIDKHSTKFDHISKMSLVGYSMGGLISRYALGLLYKVHYFKKNKIQLINFTTFCTPHIGVSALGKNYSARLFNATIPWLLGKSGKQMFLEDTAMVLDGIKIPLIELMSLQNSVFVKALKDFKHLSLYANIINDKRTAWWTAAISLNDPFFQVNEQNGHKIFKSVEGFENVILERYHPITIIKSQEDEENSEGINNEQQNETNNNFFINYYIRKFFKWLVVILNLSILAPMLLTWKILQSITELLISTVRVSIFLKMYSHHLLNDLLEVPLIEDTVTKGSLNSTRKVSQTTTPQRELSKLDESLNDQADNLIESVYNAIEKKKLHTAYIANESAEGSNLTISIRELENQTISELALYYESDDVKELLDNFHLDIPVRRQRIIRNLNELNWQKFPVYIRNTVNTHACTIVRQRDPNFAEGELVVRHWVLHSFHKS